MVHLPALPHAEQFHEQSFTSLFLSHPPCSASSISTIPLGSLQKGAGNTFTACQLFLLAPVKGDMRKFSTDTSCCNQLKFNLQIVQTHPI